ncbi:MAG: restriction endonuclease subunit S, partial [bacterium]
MKLGQVLSIRKGKKPQVIVSVPGPAYRRLIQIDDLRAGAVPKFCPPANDEVVAYPTDVIIAWDGANAGTSSFGLSGVVGSTLALLRIERSDVFTNYLGHFVRARRQYLRERCKGATVPHIDGRVLEALDIPLPPLTEQRRIADILDRAEALRTKRRAAFAQLDTLTQAIFLDLFGEPKVGDWPMALIADVAHPSPGSIRTGPFGSQLLHSEFVDKGVAVLGIDNAVANEFRWAERRFISEAKYRELKRYTVHPGDVLITIMGTCGRCAVVPVGVPVAINTKHLCCITLDPGRCLPAFLHAYFLRHPIARRYLDQKSKGSIMAGLNMGIIKTMPIPIPPIELQHEFARRVAAVEKLKTAHSVSLTELDVLF